MDNNGKAAVIIKEKYNLTQILKQKDLEFTKKKKYAMVGQGDFPGRSSLMRTAMNIKHHTQHVTLDNPEFPYVYNGNENVIGANSTFYFQTDKQYRVIKIIKRYPELLNGNSYNALYFLYCSDDDSYRVIERKGSENLTETYGFDYNNEFIDDCQEGDIIPPNTVMYAPTSYDEHMNVSVGVNGRILYGSTPWVQDDAIMVSEGFANRMVCNSITSVNIPISDNTILINLYGDESHYQGLPNIGDQVKDGIVAATRQIKEVRMFSDLRDSSLNHINNSSDQKYYGNGEVIDIQVFCNNPKIKPNKINRQLIRYYNDMKEFYSQVYRTCKKIIGTDSIIDKEIRHWMSRAQNYLDDDAKWAFNDNVFSNLQVTVTMRAKTKVEIGRKIVGRFGNKTVVCKIVPDNEMPYVTRESYTDEYGAVHPAGEKMIIELVTNPLAIFNRTIPMAMIESSITFICEQIRFHMRDLPKKEQEKIMFDTMRTFNPDQASENMKIYNQLNDRKQKEYIHDYIYTGAYVRVDAFNEEVILRDAILAMYDKYPDVLRPYNIFVPKPEWGRDIHIGNDAIGFQYILMLKQSGENGFSVRSAGAISDEGLPEKSNDNTIGKHWASSTPIRFGEYETPNFLIMTDPKDFALITALYRSSMDGRKFMYEAILDEEGAYEIPDYFTSRTAEIMQVFFKSLGVRMTTVYDEDDYIGEEGDDEVIGHEVRNRVIFCTQSEMYYLKKLSKTYREYLKENPYGIVDFDEAWDYVIEHLPFKRKHLSDKIVDIFKRNLEVFTLGGEQ